VIKLALPAGDLRKPLAEVLSARGLHVAGYGEGSRAYRLPVEGHDEVAVRVFREKDIPIQVALGNYDLGICSLAWLVEMQVRFPEQPIVPLRDLGVGRSVVLAAAHSSTAQGLEELAALPVVRIASEYPSIAEAFAMAARFPAYRVQGVWGAAEAYPPEDADVAVLAATDGESVRSQGLRPLFELLESSAWLLANRASLGTKELGDLLALLVGAGQSAPAPRRPDGPYGAPVGAGGLNLPGPLPLTRRNSRGGSSRETVRLAVPDGHQQRHVVDALRAAGLALEGYDESTCLRRPASPIEGLEVKVVRPQDMPQLVATGEFDLAISGRDCLMDHRYRFPSSPVEEVLDLHRAEYNLCAVVSEDVPADGIEGALELWRSQGRAAVRVAAELPGIADHYARSRRFWRYQIIPIAGASEGFVPEDADLLIEGTETGRTLAENRLKPIDLLFRSTTCVIARRDSALSGRRRDVFEELLAALGRAAGAPERV